MLNDSKTADAPPGSLDPVVGRYEVWFEPTEKGAKAFGWKEGKSYNATFLLEEAQLEAHMLRHQEAHDFGEYGRYVVRAVTPNEKGQA